MTQRRRGMRERNRERERGIENDIETERYAREK